MPYNTPNDQGAALEGGVLIGNVSELQQQLRFLLLQSDNLNDAVWSYTDSSGSQVAESSAAPQSGSARFWRIEDNNAGPIGRIEQVATSGQSGVPVTASVTVDPAASTAISCALVVDYGGGDFHRLEIATASGEIIGSTGIGAGRVEAVVSDGFTYYKLIITIAGSQVPVGLGTWRFEPDTVPGSNLFTVIIQPTFVRATSLNSANPNPLINDPPFMVTGEREDIQIAGRIPNSISGQLEATREFIAPSNSVLGISEADLGRVIRVTSSAGVQVSIALDAGLPNGFYFYIDTNGVNTAGGADLRVLGLQWVNYNVSPPANIGGGAVVFSSSVNSSTTMFKVVVNRYTDPTNTQILLFTIAGPAGGGGVVEPAGQVVFGTGAGVTSDPGVLINPALGLIALGPLPDSVLGIGLDVGNRTTAGGGAPIAGNAGNGFGGGAGGFISWTTGSGNGAGVDGDFIIQTGNAAPVERFRIVGETGDWNLAANPGANLQALLSQGPGLPPVWGTALQSFVGSFTRNLTLASGTQIVSGIGFTPKAVLFWAGDFATTFIFSWGFGIVGSGFCVDFGALATLKSDALSTDPNGAGTDFQRGEILSVASGQFTINWTKTGLPTGTANIGYLALG